MEAHDTTDNVQRRTPCNTEEMESILERAQSENHIAILKVGETENDWMEKTNPEEKITMVDCSFLRKDDIKEIFERCEEKMVNKTLVSIKTITNMGEPEAILVISSSPTTLTELGQLITFASDENMLVRCAGTEHSWAPISSDRNNLLIDMKNMKSDYEDGLRIRSTPGRPDALDIMPGITQDEIEVFHSKTSHYYGYLSLDYIEMVDLEAAGCHIMGKDEKLPIACVEKMRIINAKGELITFAFRNYKMFEAILAHFGCFGLIYDMTIRGPPIFTLEVKNNYSKLKNIFYDAGQLEKIFEGKRSRSVEMIWFLFNSKRCKDAYKPEDDEVLIRVIDKVKVGAFPYDTFDFDIQKEKEYQKAKEPTLMMSSIKAENPALTPLISRSEFGILKEIVYPTDTFQLFSSNSFHFKQYIDMAPVYDMEFAFDMKSISRVQDITEVVVNKVRDYEKKGEYPLNIALKMRKSGYSDVPLCPGSIGNPEYHGSGQVLYVDILSVVDTDGWKTFCIEVALEWMKLEGVPNLAKQWDFIPGIENHIYKLMKLQIDEFKFQLKESFCDQKGMFINKSLQKLFNL